MGSLFTFVPYLNGIIGYNHTSSHLVATATVFFNPAKTLGGMVEAAAYGWGYVVFALIICLGSMFTTDYFVDRNYFLVAHLISLLFWLAGSTFIVSFLKAHWNKPPVATASSLCFIIIFIIVVREGSVNLGDFDTTRIEQITTSVATGTLITVACCILFWPISAAKKLKKDVDSTLTSYRVLLKLLTKTFLLDDDLPEFKANRTLQTAIQSHQASFTALQKSLKEAKLETLWNSEVRGREEEYDQVIKSMQRLSQHMGGLRSSCGLQFEIMGSEATKQYKEFSRQKKQQQQQRKRSLVKNASAALFGTSFSSNNNKSYGSIKRRNTAATTGATANNKYSQSFVPVSSALNDTADNWNVRAGYRRRKLQDEMRKQKTFISKSDDKLDQLLSNYNNSAKYLPSTSKQQQQYQDQDDLDNSGTSLINFIQTIRPPLKSFAYTCKRTLYHLQTSFSTVQSTTKSTRPTPSMQVLKANLEKAIALFENAQKQAVKKLYKTRLDYIIKRSDNSKNGETIESEAIGCVLGEEVILVYFFVFNMTEFARELITLVDSVEKLNNACTTGLFGWFISSIKSKWHHWTSKDDSNQHHHHIHLNITPFVPNERNTFNTLHTPEPKTKWRRFFIRVWRTFSLFKLQKIRYAIKATVATVLLATPAFMESTQDWYREYRMEWALITVNLSL